MKKSWFFNKDRRNVLGELGEWEEREMKESDLFDPNRSWIDDPFSGLLLFLLLSAGTLGFLTIIL